MCDELTKQWIKNKQDETAVEQGCYFDLDKANWAVDFIEEVCTLSKGTFAGKPFKLLDWQKYRLIMPLFGWQRPGGTRRFKEAYTCMAKKNGKSALASAIELYMLVADGEEGAEVYTAATTKQQANIVHNEVASIVEKSPELNARLSIGNSSKTITLNRDSWIRALASDGPSAEGPNAHCLCIDEYHAWKTKKHAKFHKSIVWSMAARVQPLIFTITTVGDDLDSLCGTKHLYARKVINGEVEDIGFFALIFEPEESLDFNKEEVYLDKKNWYAANPSMGVTISEESFAEDLKRALASPDDWAAFLRYRFNVWTSSDQPWMPMADWAICGKQRPVIESELIGRDCFSGLDLSTTQDTTALVHVFPEPDGGYIVLPRIWVPGDRVKENAEKGLTNYLKWARDEFIFSCPGAIIDYPWVMEQILEDAKNFNIKELHFDRWGAVQMAQTLEEEGLPVIEAGQGFKTMSPPSKELYRLVKQHKLYHGDNPALNWMAGNVVVQKDEAENIKPMKNKSKGKIDAVVALIMALSGAIKPQDKFVSNYEKEGIAFL